MKNNMKFKFFLLKTLLSIKSLNHCTEPIITILQKKVPDKYNYKLLKHRYVIIEKIGSGGMSEIFSGVDLDRSINFGVFNPVAIKVLKSEFLDCNEAIYSLESEYIIGQKFTHKTLVKSYDFVSDANDTLLVMERLEGRTLNFLKNKNNEVFNTEQKFNLLKNLIDALAFIHANFIIHGDLKPSNIFICNDGMLKIIDFGLSSTPSRSSPNTAYAFSEKFASPERILGGQPSYTDDVYALGCIAHIILTGRHPFGNLSSIDAKNANLTPPKVFGIDNKAQNLIDKTLSFDPVDRPGNAQELYSRFSFIFK